MRRKLTGTVVALGLIAMSLLAGPAARAATKDALLDEVPLAAGSTLRYDLVAYGPYGGFRATFAKAQRSTGRVVSLQLRKADAWVEVASKKMTAKGEAVFSYQPRPGQTYRAVADVVKGKGTKPAVAPVTTKQVSVVPLAREWRFDGPEADWSHRNTGSFKAGGRLCAAPSAKNATFEDGKAVLKVTKVSDKALVKKVTKAAKAAQKKARKAQVGCPNGIFHNAMLSTQGAFSAKTGTIAARVKFPLGQGMHTGLWLQSAAHSELDVVESYGYGKYVTSGIHLKGKQTAKYILKQTIRSKSWWNRYHIVAVKWDRKTVSMWVDGTKVQQIKKTKPDTDYYLVLSLLTSDWETSTMTRPRHGARGVKKANLATSKFYVDWIKYWDRV